MLSAESQIHCFLARIRSKYLSNVNKDCMPWRAAFDCRLSGTVRKTVPSGTSQKQLGPLHGFIYMESEPGETTQTAASQGLGGTGLKGRPCCFSMWVLAVPHAPSAKPHSIVHHGIRTSLDVRD